MPTRLRGFRHLASDETGLVLPILTLILVALLVFAAFAIDLGAAWAERRTDQSGADAAVMAGAMEIIVDGPSQTAIVDEVRDYVERNVGLPAASPDWVSCVDPGRGASYVPLVDSNSDVMDCISVDFTSQTPSLILRVKVPDQEVETSFARVIGIDTVTVSAAAEAELKIGPDGIGGIIPFALPQDYDPEECLGTPPDGQIPEDSLCDGPEAGNFGIIDSPHFGDPKAPHGTSLTCPPPNLLGRVSHQVAIGLDHFVYSSPNPIPPSNSEPVVGSDNCPQQPFPYVLNTRTGDPFSGGGGGAWPPIPKSPNVAVAVGLVGDGPFGFPAPGYPGRLRQTGGHNTGLGADVRSLQATDPPTFAMDNVGLWEYLLPSSSGSCSPANFSGMGTVLTEAMATCLADNKAALDAGGGPLAVFDEFLVDAPRFAYVPRLKYKPCSDASDPLCLNGNAWVHIIDFRAVYLQSTWYACGGGGAGVAPHCVWETDDGKFLQVFNPGEGTDPFDPDYYGCRGIADDGITPGMCTGYSLPNQIRVQGVSAFVLEWESVPDADPTGTGSPYVAEMFR